MPIIQRLFEASSGLEKHLERCEKRLMLESSAECQARCLLKVGVGMPVLQ